MHTVVHDVEGWIEKRWQWPNVGMNDIETAPFFRRQSIENGHHLLVITLETRNSLFTRETAKCLGILVQRFTHHQQAKRVSRPILTRHVPARKIALGDIDHMPDDITHLPLGAARLHVPVLRLINNDEEIAGLGTNYVQYDIFAAVIH